MRKAEIKTEPNWSENSGPDVFYFVELYKDGDYFGKIDVTEKSKYYRQDVVENWENGILGENNEYIRKSEQSS